MDESEIIENLNEQWDFIAEQVIQIAGLLFDGNPDFRLINSEIIRNKILTVITFENGEDFEFSSDYLDNVSKMNCGQAWHSLVNARKIIDSRNNVLLANSHIVEAGVLVGCAWRHHQSVTVKSSECGKKAHIENNSISDFAIEHYLLELEKRGKYPKAQAAKDMAGKIVNLTESTLERKTLTPKSIEEYKQRKSKSTPC